MCGVSGPCLCGDPYCGRCFPQPVEEEDPDAYYERTRQEEAPVEENLE